MRRALEIVLMAGGVLATALGLDMRGHPGQEPWTALGLVGLGVLVLAGGIALSLRRGATPPSPAQGSLGAATLDFGPKGPPRLVGREPSLAVIAEGDGTVRIRLRGRRRAALLGCRVAGAAYFNTLSRTSREVRIKLIAPVPRTVRLELFEQGTGGD
jgi:hypothetical protein